MRRRKFMKGPDPLYLLRTLVGILGLAVLLSLGGCSDGDGVDAASLDPTLGQQPTDTGTSNPDTSNPDGSPIQTPTPGGPAGPIPEITNPDTPYGGFPVDIPPVQVAPGQEVPGTTPPTPEEVEQLAELYIPHSMLLQADSFAIDIAGDSSQWEGPYMHPLAEQATREAAEFLTIYPRSYLTPEDQDVLSTLADDQLWQALNEIGITLMHPVAFEQAGSVVEDELQHSVDGGFDRIALYPEPRLGTTEDVRSIVRTAAEYGAVVAGDIIPLHLGAGYDFRLAEMNYEDYPGIFDMIEVPKDMWDMLPTVEDQWGFAILLKDEALPFIEAGLLPGMYDVLLGREESTDWSGWAATGPIMGVDGETRRWLYAFLFKPEQPAMNWMDPTYAARIIQAGDIVKHVENYGTIINRLDAVPFLGLEPLPDSPQMDIFTTPLAINGTEDLAFMHRKLGGYSWVELNVPTEEYHRYMEYGPDVGYDFFTRAQTVHPLITADARILRVAHRSLIQAGVDYSRLIHALQNHDEIAYQLINLRSQDQVQYGDVTISGSELADRIEQQMKEAVAPPAAPYNALYRPSENGIATTYAGFIAPALGINPYEATAEQVETIKQAHVMLAVVNAMQPGVFALSQWDLVGALPVDRGLITERIDQGDYRWLNRGAVDLMGNSEQVVSAFGMPEAQNLYGPLPQQLDDPNSFASQVANIIQSRKSYNISDAEVLAAPDLQERSAFALLMKLPDEVGGYAVTAANYGRDQVTISVDFAEFLQGSGGLEGTPTDILFQQSAGTLEGTQLTFPLEGLTGTTIVIGANPVPVDDSPREPDIPGGPTDGEMPDGETPDGGGSGVEVPDGETPDGGGSGVEMPDGETPDGGGSGVEMPDGETPDGGGSGVEVPSTSVQSTPVGFTTE